MLLFLNGNKYLCTCCSEPTRALLHHKELSTVSLAVPRAPQGHKAVGRSTGPAEPNSAGRRGSRSVCSARPHLERVLAYRAVTGRPDGNGGRSVTVSRSTLPDFQFVDESHPTLADSPRWEGERFGRRNMKYQYYYCFVL